MYKVRKRNGKIVSFDLTKITEVIRKAFEAENTNYTDDIVDFLARKVTAEFSTKIEDNIVNVEDIQDAVETVLFFIENYMKK